MKKHIPGPWIREGMTIYSLMHNGWRKGVEQFRNRFRLHLDFDKECSEDEVEATTTLIEAAPDLLAAAKLVQEFFECIELNSLQRFAATDCKRLIEAAVRKAEK